MCIQSVSNSLMPEENPSSERTGKWAPRLGHSYLLQLQSFATYRLLFQMLAEPCRTDLLLVYSISMVLGHPVPETPRHMFLVASHAPCFSVTIRNSGNG